MRPAAWFRIAALVALLLSTTSIPGAGAQEADDRPALDPWALEGTGVRSIALAADGDLLAGTMNGLWRVSPDAKGAEPYPAAGLPEPCRALDGQTPGRCSVGWVAVAPNGDVYAVIGDTAVSANAGGVGYVGLFRNPAGSDSWGLVAAPADLEVRRPDAFWVDQVVGAIRLRGLAIGPDGAVSIIASANDGYQPTPRDCVHRSADDGATWTPVFCGSGEVSEIDGMAIGPDGRGWLNAGYFYFAPARFTITSPNAIDDWDERGIDPAVDGGDRGHYIAGFAFDAQGRTYVTTEPGATAGTEGYPLGVYRTADGGLTWERLTPEGLSLGLNAIAVAADGKIFYGSGGSILASSDEGRTWIDAFQPVERITALQIGDDGSLWVGTEAVLYRSPGPAADGPVRVQPMPSPQPAAGAPQQEAAGPTATAGGDQDTGRDAARLACQASGGAFTELPGGGYECRQGDPLAAAREACFASGGEFWQRANGDFGCRRSGG